MVPWAIAPRVSPMGKNSGVEARAADRRDRGSRGPARATGGRGEPSSGPARGLDQLPLQGQPHQQHSSRFEYLPQIRSGRMINTGAPRASTLPIQSQPWAPNGRTPAPYRSDATP